MCALMESLYELPARVHETRIMTSGHKTDAIML